MKTVLTAVEITSPQPVPGGTWIPTEVVHNVQHALRPHAWVLGIRWQWFPDGPHED